MKKYFFVTVLVMSLLYADDVEYFKQNKEKIIQDIINLSNNKNYTEAFKLLSKYMSSKDTDLIEIQKKVSL